MRKFGRSEELKYRKVRTGQELINLRLQAVRKMINFGKIPNHWLGCEGNAKKELDEQELELVLNLRNIRANPIWTIEKGRMMLSREPEGGDNSRKS
jgi:hypothetical protein